MPINYKNYPPDWHEISRRIRFERAKGRCEWCGAPNGAYILRSSNDPAKFIIFDMAEGAYLWPDGSPIRMSEVPEEYEDGKPLARIVLTVHHAGVPYPDGRPGDRADKADCRDENLVALCQRCHLLADQDIRIKHCRQTRRRRKIEAGQLCLAGME